MSTISELGAPQGTVACITLTPAVHTEPGGSDAPWTMSHVAWLGAQGRWPRLAPHWELLGLPHSMEAGFQEQGASWKEGDTGHLHEWVTVSLLRCSAGQANTKPPPSPHSALHHQIHIHSPQSTQPPTKSIHTAPKSTHSSPAQKQTHTGSPRGSSRLGHAAPGNEWCPEICHKSTREHTQWAHAHTHLILGIP